MSPFSETVYIVVFSYTAHAPVWPITNASVSALTVVTKDASVFLSLFLFHFPEQNLRSLVIRRNNRDRVETLTYNVVVVE